MAAYVAVISLKQTIERLLDPSQPRFLLPNSEMELMYQDLCYFQSYLEKISSLQSNDIVHAWQRQIKDLALEMEDLIESHISYLSLLEYESSGDESLTLAFSQQLLKARQGISSLTKMLKTEKEYHAQGQQPNDYHDVSSRNYFDGNNKLVGVDDEIRDIKDFVLTGLAGLSDVNVVTVYGMAGIGKTAIVNEVYSDALVIDHFDCRLLLPIGPLYQLKEILLVALNQLGIHIHKKMDEEESLREYLYNSLKGTRYLIVFDDVWTEQVWNELKQLVPSPENGSRVILTSRMIFISRSTRSYLKEIRFLNDDESWNLLHGMVFTTEESCNPQLEKIGRKIAKKCEGLPLAILEVGKLLCKTEKTVEKWKKIAKNEDPLVITADDSTPFSETLFLSYKMLPQYLKACFLYMGTLPKHHVIRRSKLVELWVSEGFVEPQNGKSYEEMGNEYLDDLSCQNVVLAEGTRTMPIWTCKAYKLHFTFRNLCVSEAKNEKFFCVIKKYANSSPDYINGQRRLCIHNNVVLGFKQVHSWMQSISGARSLLCLGPKHQYPVRVCLHFRLLRVLKAHTLRFYEFPYQILELVQLRYLAITYDGQLPPSIYRLWNLEVLIVHRHQTIKFLDDAPVYLPMEIWRLKRLKHLKCMGSDLPDPSAGGEGINGYDSLILDKLLTLSGVSVYSCTQGVLSRLPNLMKLGIRIESAPDDSSAKTFDFPDDFAYDLCRHLEKFKCIVVNPVVGPSQVTISNLGFPINIKKITFSGCGFPWDGMGVIGKLPNLLALKLRCNAFRGPVWRTYKGEFLQLKFLLLEDLDIEYFISTSGHFPMINCLIIKHCYKLLEFPSEIGGFCIEVHDCSPSVRFQQIQEYPYLPAIDIHSSWDDDKVKLTSLRPKGFGSLKSDSSSTSESSNSGG